MILAKKLAFFRPIKTLAPNAARNRLLPLNKKNAVNKKRRRMTNPKTKCLLLLIALIALIAIGDAGAGTIYVKASGNYPTPNGASWKTAFKNLQDALDATAPGDEIWIAEGIYTPSKIYSPNGVTGGASGLNTASLKTFNLPDHVTLYGGFKGNERSLNQRPANNHKTVLSGSTGTGKCWHVVTAGNDIAQTGVTAT